jgi:DNA-binding PadR family transcriptional regulator
MNHPKFPMGLASAYPKIIRVLAESRNPLTKYDLEREAKLARQTVYDNVRKLKRFGIIEVAETGKSRTGLPMERYRLTERGWYCVAVRHPDLEKRARQVLGPRFGQYTERIRLHREGEFQRWTQLIHDVVTVGRASPGWRFLWEIEADREGRIWSRVQVGFPRKRPRSHVSRVE